MSQQKVLTLRNAKESDLEIFFNDQLDDEASHMAAFTPKDRTDKEAYMTKWKKLLADNPLNHKTILSGGNIAGSVLTYEMNGEPQVSYWISKPYWGQGIATRSLQLFLEIMQKRPVFGRAASDNIGSIRVLEKCGFEKAGTDRGFSNARNAEIEEVIYRLDK